MFCINISWFACTFVAVAIATDSTGENYISESPMAEPVEKLKPSTGVELAAAEGARLAAHGSPEPPARTSSTAPADCGTSPHAATQSYSSHSSRQSPATAAPTVDAQTVAQTADGRISPLRSLSAEEKGSRLIEAAAQGAVRELEALLAAGANVAARAGYMDSTALHCAARNGHEETASRLLAAGADADTKDAYAWTPLHEAADNGHAAVARLLLAAGVERDPKNDDWGTPLHLAAANGHREVAAALLEAGADRALRDNNGWTPLQYARRRKHQLVVELLEGESSLTATTLPE